MSDGAPVSERSPDSGAAVVTVNAARLASLLEVQRVLLGARDLSPLVKYLIEDLPRVQGASVAELRVHDPAGNVAKVLSVNKLFGDSLRLEQDSGAIHALYPDFPDTAVVGFQDERMFSLFPDADSISAAVMMPLLDGNRLIGSFHLGFSEDDAVADSGELPLFAMLGQLVAYTLLRVYEQEATERLTLVDPVTEVANFQAFRRDMAREISWSRRNEAPLSLLHIGIHELSDLCSVYGEVACNFLQRRVSQRLCAELRATDYIAHLSTTEFAVLLPSCSEPHAHDISERMRTAVEQLAIDNGRGAILHVTLSIGLVSWEPTRHHVESDERLATQLEAEAEGAMKTSDRAGGNRITVARLGALML